MNRRGRASALILLGMIACVLADALAGVSVFRMAARVLLVAFLAVEWGRMAANARIMVAIAVLATAAASTVIAEPLRAVEEALDAGAFFATFFANQFFLREAARTSPLVHRCSAFFVNQAPPKRYVLLTLGGYLFGIILSLGVLSLLGIMITRRNSLTAAGGIRTVRELRERRMILPLLRGFSVTTLASPLSISMALMLNVLPGLHWTAILPLGVATGALLLGLGWMQDRMRPPCPPGSVVPLPEVGRDTPALLGVVALVLLVFALAVAVEHIAAIPLSRAILVSLPLVGVGWLAAQYLDYGARTGSLLIGRRIVRNAAKTFPNYRTEIAILSSAGFIGTLFSALVPSDWLGTVLSSSLLPPALLPILAVLMVVVPALAGVNPIVSVTILASGLAASPNLAVSPEVLAVSLMAGWCMAINSSALTASSMLLGELIGRPAETIVLRWNGPFTVAALGLLGLWLAGLSVLMR
ncbi:MAG: hypothetical protein NVV74_16260 [Magnetospirillum sp.]|nr:hypothetical protein [Magnetospirillum sp.]